MESQGWRSEVMEASYNGVGGNQKSRSHGFLNCRFIQNSSMNLCPPGTTHVPVTEGQGRVHTSTATVLVMPEIRRSREYDIDPKDSGSTSTTHLGARWTERQQGRNSRSYRPLANHQGRDARRTDPTEEPRKKPRKISVRG